MSPLQSPISNTGNRYVLGSGTFQFACHDGVSCFTRCCHDADMYLYPYDIVRMKQHLGITSEAFLTEHTTTAIRDMPTFPNVMLKMSDWPGKPCTFLTEKGCTIYADRPYSCRAYPLEPAICGDEDGTVRMQHYVMRHGHCKGHNEDRTWTAEAWMADQEMNAYHAANSSWARIAARFQTNPFGPRGIDSPPMKMAFMASYNVDTFRRFVFESSFLSRYDVEPQQMEAIKRSDSQLLILGLAWIDRFLFGEGPLQEKGEAVFRDKHDCQAFFQALIESRSQAGWALPALDLNPDSETDSLLYSIQPNLGPEAKFHASVPSFGLRNIVSYYHQVHAS